MYSVLNARDKRHTRVPPDKPFSENLRPLLQELRPSLSGVAREMFSGVETNPPTPPPALFLSKKKNIIKKKI